MTVYTVGTRAQVYHHDKQCIIDRREEKALEVPPRETTLKQAERRGLEECSYCSTETYERDNVGGGISKLERILREQDKGVADD